jgi:hypothetical protein
MRKKNLPTIASFPTIALQKARRGKKKEIFFVLFAFFVVHSNPNEFD